MIHHTQQKILFKHCDPAGIVFYPRYFEIVNDAVEGFFGAIGFPYETLHETASVPTVKIETEFTRPSRHGDVLDIALNARSIGRTSLALTLLLHGPDGLRMSFRSTMVHVDLKGAPTPWPDDLRAALTHFVEEET
jgi:4-hydroxybenzoyl-CoA thioesterase